MKKSCKIAMIVPAVLAVAYGQASSIKTEFDAASIRVNPPRAGFHFVSDSGSGGPGSADPGMFRCSNCTLATLIGKAFDLQNYQFPGRTSLGDSSFDIMAKIPPGATPDEFRAMLQNLLKERFGLTYHFKEKGMRGYHLGVARSGSKLKESVDTEPFKAADDANTRRQNGSAEQHRFGQGDAHTHNGLIVLGGSVKFRGERQTTGDLARLLADQLGVPVDNQTGLTGKYDISLAWAGNIAHSGNHPEGAWGGGGHGDHGGDGPGAVSGSNPGDTSGPSLFEALQSQLGLRLVPAEQTVARIFVIDHVEQLPTAN
ncbi:MAG TPA: TIGR03435 family protein [Bryobacteraceae bacterium]